jgi:hypothetical protein
MLREFARKLLADATKAEPSSPGDSWKPSGPIGTLSDISQFPVPLYGEVDGIGPVTMTADANMRGFSPVTKCIDRDREVAWIPTDRILATDPRLQPISGSGTPMAERAARQRRK